MAKIKQEIDTKKAKETITKGRRAKWLERKGGKKSGFRYVEAGGKQIKNEKHLERIKLLVIPPAWKSVRISPAPSSKIQAVGMDTSGRVQYLYNNKFRKKQERKKFEKIEKFGEHLPKLRKITNEHLELEGFPREKVLALMTRLINSLYIRMGSPNSVKRYKTFGITTLQNRHLEIKRGGKLIFNFVGKHHIKHRKIFVDKELAGVMQELKSIGGARKLFNYLDENGKPHPIKSSDVNKYLKQITAPEFSAKDFRTWGGTLLAALELAEIGKADEEKVLKKNICKAIKNVAGQLGNTPTVCRASYVHPKVIESYESGITIDEFKPKRKRKIKKIKAEFEPEETALMKLFRSNA
ncbi:MAG: DNA topoisomerase IB [Acidobacteriota bacterium]